jgi:hypothetical protein
MNRTIFLFIALSVFLTSQLSAQTISVNSTQAIVGASNVDIVVELNGYSGADIKSIVANFTFDPTVIQIVPGSKVLLNQSASVQLIDDFIPNNGAGTLQTAQGNPFGTMVAAGSANGPLIGFQINIVNDDAKVGDHTIGIDVSNILTTTNANISPSHAAGTVSVVSFGVTTAAIDGTTTTEAGGIADFTVVLNTQPTKSVTVNLIDDDATEGVASPLVARAGSFTFTTNDWNVPQTARVTGQNDDTDDGDGEAYTVSFSTVSDDANYDGLTVIPYQLFNTDDDTAGVTVSVADSSTDESSATGNFTVVLDSEPTDNVTVNLASSDDTEGQVTSGSVLTFTPSDWDQAQTVTVTGQDDDIDENGASVGYTIDLTVTSGSDNGYNGIAANSANLTNADNDGDTTGVTVIVTDATTSEVGSASEKAGTFTVVLTSEPTDDVTIDLASDNAAEGIVTDPAGKQLTFTAGDWDQAQAVTVTGQDELIDDGDVSYSVGLTVNSTSDNNYDGFTASSAGFTNVDDDEPGIVVSVTNADSEEDGTAAVFEVRLGTEPTDTVTLTFTSSETGEGTLADSTLEFTTSDWDQTQTLTVNGLDDAELDGNIAYTLTVSGSGNDVTYGAGALDFIRVGAGSNSSVIALNNLDNEASSIEIVLGSGRAAATAGVALPIHVIARDVNGRSADLNGSHNLTFTGPSAGPSGILPTVNNQDIGSIALNFTAGTASTEVKAFKAETTALNATLDSNVAVDTSSGGSLALEVSPAAADRLLFVTAPTGPNTAGVAWANFSAEITDEFGNRTADNSHIDVTSDLGGFQTGTTTVQASGGLATFSGLAHETAGTHTVTADVSGLTQASESGIAVDPATIDHYAVTFGGAAQTAGSAFNVSIQAQDAFNNDITSGGEASETVNLSTAVSDSPLTPSSVSTTSGAASASVTATVATGAQSITFTGATSGQTGTTVNFVVNPGALNHLTFTDQPSNSVAVPGTIASGGDPVIVELRDVFDNLRSGDSSTVNVSLIDANTNSAVVGPILSGTTSAVANGGVATFTDLEVDTEGVYKLRAASNEPSGNSAAFAIGDPPPAETASSASIDNGGDLTKIFTTDEAAGRVVNLSASFDETVNPGRGQVTQGTVASVEWAIDGNIVQTDNNATDTFTSTFDFTVGLDRVSSVDGSHGNTQVFEVTATAKDNNGSPTILTWTITVNDTNQAPSITGVTITVQGGGSAFADSTLLATPQGEADADNDDVTYSYEWFVNGGSLAQRVGGDDTLTGHFSKDEVITVKATPQNATRDDNQTGASQTSAGVTILNSVPTVDDQVGAADDNATDTIDLSNNALDVDSDSLTYSVSGSPSHGSVQITDANADYTADWPELAEGEQDTDAFTFQANDGTDPSNNGTVTITVTGVNDAPTADSQSVNVRANAAGGDVNSIEITLSGDDIDSDDTATSLDFEILSLPEGDLTSSDGPHATVNIGTVLTVSDFPLTFVPTDDFRGLTQFTFQTIDQYGTRSAVTTVKITVGTPPWFRFVDLTEYDGGLDAEEPVGFYQVEIKDGTGAVVLFTQIANKAAVEPSDYLNAGSSGLLPGTYSITVRKFNGTGFDTLAQDAAFVVDDYPVATAQEGGAPTTANGNRVFSFDLDFAAGYMLRITQPDGEVLEFIVTFRPDNDGVIPLSGTFTKSVFLPQAGGHTYEIIAFNPKGESVASVGAEFANTGGDFAPAPSVVDVREMVPGGWNPNAEIESDVRNAPFNAGTAATVDGDSVANITFSWGAADGARGYSMFLSTYGREVIINTDSTIDGNATTFGPIALPPGEYFWHIIAINDQGGSWSRAAYFRIASDPNSDLPNIDDINAAPGAAGVTFEASALRNASHVQLEVVKRTDSTHHLSLFVPEGDFAYLLANGEYAPDVNIPNELFVYQARAVNLAAGHAGNFVTGSPAISSASRWTALRRYNGHDGSLGGIGTIDVDEVDITAGWPTLTIDVPGATNIQVQYRKFTPAFPFTFTDPTDPTANVEVNNSEFTVPAEFQGFGIHVHIRVRGTDAGGTAFGPWSGWAVHVNSSTR